VRPRLRAELSAASASLERDGLRAWTIGTLPKTIALPGTGQTVLGHPALVDEGETVAVRVLETAEAQEDAMRAGTRRLLVLTVPSPLRAVQDRLGSATALALAGAPHGGVRAVLEDARDAAIDRLVEQAGGPAWSEEGFARLRTYVSERLVTTTAQVVEQIGRILDAAREVRLRLDGARGAALRPVRDDVERQLARLVHPGFATEAGAGRLADVERYLRAAARRLDRLPDGLGADLDRMRHISELEEDYARLEQTWPRGRPRPEVLGEIPWALEELRVSHFAQALGVRGAVSTKRIRRMLADAASGIPSRPVAG
jgi:ATP-dependent helicase HrpA